MKSPNSEPPNPAIEWWGRRLLLYKAALIAAGASAYILSSGLSFGPFLQSLFRRTPLELTGFGMPYSVLLLFANALYLLARSWKESPGRTI